ncbi:MAG: YbjQ family protein [Rickettsiales bacterium]
MLPTRNVTSALELPGHRINESLGIVRGLIVRSRGIGGNIIGCFMTIFGGNNTIYSNLCEDARQHAFDLMLQHAEERGANAVIGFRYDATELMSGLTEVLAYGTACKVEKL